METRKEILARLQLKPNTFHTTLSIMHIKPTEIRVIDGRATHFYDAAAVARIEALFKPKGVTNA